MSAGLLQQHRTEYSVNTLNFNQAADTVLATFFFPRRVTIIRYGIIAEASEGLIAAGVLNLAIAVQGGELADPAVGGDDFAVGDRGAIADDKVIIQGQGPCQLPFGVQVAFLVHRVSNLKALPTARFDPGIGAQGGIDGR